MFKIGEDSGLAAVLPAAGAAGVSDQSDVVRILSPCLDSDCDAVEAADRVCHLVQDEDLIARIHNEELPPDCYYQELELQLAILFPDSTEDGRHHVVALCAAFDTAAGFGLSFGIKKFQFMQKKVKLVGEIVGEDGRSPNPVLCEAIRKYPPINCLKDLQGFLGTTNYVRPHAGPSYSRIMAPLRALLKADAVWPMTREQLAAVEGLKGLVMEDHVLAVPNEQAAILAARAWQNGDPPAGCPYEAGADTSKIAMGGALGQAESPGGKLLF